MEDDLRPASGTLSAGEAAMICPRCRTVLQPCPSDTWLVCQCPFPGGVRQHWIDGAPVEWRLPPEKVRMLNFDIPWRCPICKGYAASYEHRQHREGR